MSEVVLHLGGNKTGSTALQQALLQGREELASTGVVYPDFSRLFPTGPTQHWALALGFQTNPERYYVMQAHRYGESQIHDLIDRARERVLDASREFPTTLLSAEAFANLERVEMEALCTWIHGQFSSIKVVYYARPPGFGKFYSMFQQFVKSGHAPSAAETVRHRVFDQMGQASKIRQAFPEGRMRVYEKASLRNGDIVSDFCFVAGIPIPKSYKAGHQINRSLSRGAIALLHVINRQASCFGQSLKSVRQELVAVDRTVGFPSKSLSEIPPSWEAELVLHEIDEWADYLVEAGEVAEARALKKHRPMLVEQASNSELLSRSEAFQCWLDSHLPGQDWVTSQLSRESADVATKALLGVTSKEIRV